MPHTIPDALRKKMRAEPDSMDAASEIITVSKPSQWISSMPVVPMTGSIIRLRHSVIPLFSAPLFNKISL